MLNSLYYIQYIPCVLVQCIRCLDCVRLKKAIAKHVKVDHHIFHLQAMPSNYYST